VTLIVFIGFDFLLHLRDVDRFFVRTIRNTMQVLISKFRRCQIAFHAFNFMKLWWLSSLRTQLWQRLP